MPRNHVAPSAELVIAQAAAFLGVGVPAHQAAEIARTLDRLVQALEQVRRTEAADLDPTSFARDLVLQSR